MKASQPYEAPAIEALVSAANTEGSTVNVSLALAGVAVVAIGAWIVAATRARNAGRVQLPGIRDSSAPPLVTLPGFQTAAT